MTAETDLGRAGTAGGDGEGINGVLAGGGDFAVGLIFGAGLLGLAFGGAAAGSGSLS